MALNLKEDQTCPINEEQILKVLSSSREDKKAIVDKILAYLDEKRDAYHGILHSIIHIVNCKDAEMIEMLKEQLVDAIVSNPMSYAGKMFLNKVLFRLTQEEACFVIHLFEHIINTTSKWQRSFDEEKDILKLQMISLKSIRKAENTSQNKTSILDKIEIDTMCDKAINKCDDATKIDTLCFVLEHRKSTQPFEDRQLKLFKIIFADGIRLQDPALRQILLTETSKLLDRIFASYKAVMRCVKMYTNEYREFLEQMYKQFLNWLAQFCLDSIYCHAYFGSFGLTITTLKNITDLCSEHGDCLNVSNLLKSKRCYDSLLCCINDSFEHNKMMALELIFSLPYNKEFICEQNLLSFEQLAYQLVGSVNPSHSLTCQYIFKLIIGLRKRQIGSTKTKNQLSIEHLKRLVAIVEESVKETQDNFITALKNKPIYPKLTCIRALLNDVDIQEIEKDREDWEFIVEKLVSLSIDACKAVSTIVCNLNPETIGHIPMDLKPIDISELAKALNVSLNISCSDLSTITSQMLLISGWKTIKECSLSMGALCNLFWWPKEPIRGRKVKNPGFKSDPILGASNVIKIIDFFNHYLRNLRHRGAFEQAYNGFILVTKRIWHDQKFRDLLTDTLEVIMNDFKNETQDEKKLEYLKAYVTRRSAGLPFIVKAILNSEFRRESKTLKWVMNCIYVILNDEKSKNYQRIHCLNILRALIKEHDLNEKVLPFVGQTIEIALKSFTSDSFPIRNCANMLLKAVVDRTFGVNRLRGDIHRRNQLSFEKFFTECPGLQYQMLNYLKMSQNDGNYLAAVHSIYIILFRLTTSLETKFDEFIEPFVEPILSLAFSCPDYKLRNLSCKLVVRLESFCTCRDTKSLRASRIWDTLGQVFVEQNQTLDPNSLHASILLARYWIEEDNNYLTKAKIAVTNILNYNTGNMSPAILNELSMLAESCWSKESDDNLDWFFGIINKITPQTSLIQDQSVGEIQIFHHGKFDAYYESYIFRSLSSVLLRLLSLDPDKFRSLIDTKSLSQILELSICNLIMDNNPTNDFSSNVRASFIRFFRQIYQVKKNERIDLIVEQLDTDLLCPHMTSYDELTNEVLTAKRKLELSKYYEPGPFCSTQTGKISLHYNIFMEYMKRMTENIRKYKEFSDNTDPEDRNTPRAIELIVALYKRVECFSLSFSNTLLDEYCVLERFIKDLPDCDVKCVAIIYMGSLIKLSLDSQGISIDKGMTKRYTELIEELSEGDHSLTIRSSCSECVRLCLGKMITKHDKSFHACIKHLFLALSNLCQDEDREIRSYSQNIMVSIKNCFPEQPGYLELEANRLKELIILVASQVFDPNDSSDINHCVDLLLRLIFNNNSDHGNIVEQDEERDSLFDKSRLNDFADNVDLVQASMDAFEIFFKKKCDSQLIELDSIDLPLDIVPKFEVIESTNDNSNEYPITMGSYSLNRKKWASNKLITDNLSNSAYFSKLLGNISKSLTYFDSGYKNLLLDTEYTYNELALYKNIAFLKFVTKFTNWNKKNESLINLIKGRLRNISTKNCSTTLLVRCSELLDDNM